MLNTNLSGMDLQGMRFWGVQFKGADLSGVNLTGADLTQASFMEADLTGAVTQLRRYVERLKKTKGIEQVRGIIAAPKITANAQKMLEDWGFSFVTIHPPNYLERYDRDQTKLDGF